jgi:transcriptional regulator with XRE-family HTH domain
MQLLSNVSGPLIRKFRNRLGLTQEQFAAKLQMAGLDVSRSSLSKVEAQLTWIGEREMYYYSAVLKVSLLDLYPTLEPGKRLHEAVTQLLARRRPPKKRKRRRSSKARCPEAENSNPRSQPVTEKAKRNREFRRAKRKKLGDGPFDSQAPFE